MTALCLGCERFTECRNEHFRPYLNDQCRFSKESELVSMLAETCWALSDALIKIGDSWHPAYKLLNKTKKWFHDHGIPIEKRRVGYGEIDRIGDCDGTADIGNAGNGSDVVSG